MNLEILYQDDSLIAVNKPAGLLVHRTKMDFGEMNSAVNTLQDQLGVQVFPVHRLDKPTAGVLVFALNSETARLMSDQFIARNVKKKYLAIVRGVPKDEMIINHPLKEELDKISDKMANKNKPAQEAITSIKTLGKIELPYQVDKYPTSLYALVEATPLTGRKHQIRRHLRHINHPIIGDINHGSSKHNRFFEKEFKIRQLLLSCIQMSFQHPKTAAEIEINARPSTEFIEIAHKLGWKDILPEY